MKEETIVVCEAKEAQMEINPYLQDGWRVKSVTAENVSIASTGTREWDTKLRGYIIFVLEK